MSNPLEATQVQSSDGSGGRIPDFLERNISIARVFLAPNPPAIFLDVNLCKQPSSKWLVSFLAETASSKWSWPFWMGCWVSSVGKMASVVLTCHRDFFYLISSLGVVNSKKLSRSELFSTDFGPKVTDRPRIFPAGLIWSCTLASNLKNATCLCCSKFNRNKITF